MLSALEKQITAAENKLENLHSKEKLLTLPPAWSSSVGFHPPGGGGASSVSVSVNFISNSHVFFEVCVCVCMKADLCRDMLRFKTVQYENRSGQPDLSLSLALSLPLSHTHTHALSFIIYDSLNTRSSLNHGDSS